MEYFAILPSEILSLLLLDYFPSSDLIQILPHLINIKSFSSIFNSKRFILTLYRRDISSFLPITEEFTYQDYIKIFNTINDIDYYHDNPNDLDDTEKTVLYLSDKGFDILLYPLLNSIENLDDKLVYCNNAIMSAMRNKHFPMIEHILVVQDKTLINQPLDSKLRRQAKYYNNGALSHAAAAGRIDIIYMLMDRGADVYDLSVSQAARNGYIDIVKKLIDILKIKYKDQSEKLAKVCNNAMAHASFGGYTDIVNLMLDHGSKNYNLAMISATEGNRIDIVKLMLEKGASNIIKCAQAAKYYKHTEIVNLLQNYSKK